MSEIILMKGSIKDNEFFLKPMGTEEIDEGVKEGIKTAIEEGHEYIIARLAELTPKEIPQEPLYTTETETVTRMELNEETGEEEEVTEEIEKEVLVEQEPVYETPDHLGFYLREQVVFGQVGNGPFCKVYSRAKVDKDGKDIGIERYLRDGKGKEITL